MKIDKSKIWKGTTNDGSSKFEDVDIPVPAGYRPVESGMVLCDDLVFNIMLKEWTKPAGWLLGDTTDDYYLVVRKSDT